MVPGKCHFAGAREGGDKLRGARADAHAQSLSPDLKKKVDQVRAMRKEQESGGGIKAKLEVRCARSLPPLCTTVHSCFATSPTRLER